MPLGPLRRKMWSDARVHNYRPRVRWCAISDETVGIYCNTPEIEVSFLLLRLLNWNWWESFTEDRQTLLYRQYFLPTNPTCINIIAPSKVWYRRMYYVITDLNTLRRTERNRRLSLAHWRKAPQMSPNVSRRLFVVLSTTMSGRHWHTPVSRLICTTEPNSKDISSSNSLRSDRPWIRQNG